MPTIITRGELPGEKRYQAACSNCKTVFQFKHDETRPEAHPDPRDHVVARVITCPLHGCAKVIYVARDMALPPVPPRIVPLTVPPQYVPPDLRSTMRIGDDPNYYRDH
ncbi:hypothetical protein D3C71_1459780 [compost metagenome]